MYFMRINNVVSLVGIGIDFSILHKLLKNRKIDKNM